MSDPVSIKDATDVPRDIAADQVSGYGRVQISSGASGRWVRTG